MNLQEKLTCYPHTPRDPRSNLQLSICLLDGRNGSFVNVVTSLRLYIQLHSSQEFSDWKHDMSLLMHISMWLLRRTWRRLDAATPSGQDIARARRSHQICIRLRFFPGGHHLGKINSDAEPLLNRFICLCGANMENCEKLNRVGGHMSWGPSFLKLCALFNSSCCERTVASYFLISMIR